MSLSRADQDLMLNNFRRLMDDLARNTTSRNCFQRWEVDLLLDIHGCELRPAARRDVLSRYRRAVERQFDKGADAPLKLSEFLRRHR
jgi:hypothetical protein